MFTLPTLTGAGDELALALLLQVHYSHVHDRPQVGEGGHGGEEGFRGGVLLCVQAHQSEIIKVNSDRKTIKVNSGVETFKC